MGICLDTEQSHQQQQASVATWQEENASTAAGDFRYMSRTPANGRFPMQNVSGVHFEAPGVPVVFVLGGPGSGKVTHCDNFMQDHKGVIHINMTDLLQQYAIGNEMQDFSQLSSRTVTEVLMLEMKMAPDAKTYLISGYPRSMRDVVEYSEKIQIVNGVILISWRQKVLERQIDYGAKLGQVVLSLARMELDNFFKNVMPVADYFDQSNMLIAVNGERHPGDVYKDFRTGVMRILSQQNDPPNFNEDFQQLNNTQQPSVRQDTKRTATNDVITVTSEELKPKYSSPVKPFVAGPASDSQWPRALWIIGGPGSNKAALCAQLAKRVGDTWTHISVGRLLRTAEQPVQNGVEDAASTVRRCIADGELVPLDVVMRLVESHMAAATASSAVGVLIDGFPRNIQQAAEFENKFKQRPNLILLDCSKLQLGRGRPDDTVSAFRRRLEIFREHTLPMLKTMDNVGRLAIVDGDTDTLPVQEDFNKVVGRHVAQLSAPEPQPQQVITNGYGPSSTALKHNGHLNNVERKKNGDVALQLDDLEELETVNRQVASKERPPQLNGHVPNGVAIGNGFIAAAAARHMQHVYQRNGAVVAATHNSHG